MLYERISTPENTARTRRILLLQGPVGPFFRDLQAALRTKGYFVRRVIFNAGDAAFADGANSVRFSGDLVAWEAWLRHEMVMQPPDLIILFGSNRPAHVRARQMAAQSGIAVLSLEEGYLRSGYITCESGGNNQHSPLVQWRHCNKVKPDFQPDVAPHAMARSPFPVMSLWGVVYYGMRDGFSKVPDEGLFHRRRDHLARLAVRWSAHAARRIAARGFEMRKIRQLRKSRDYILVPLQVPTDSQLLTAARGWSTPRLVEGCLQALLQADPSQRLVFKLHPLDTSGAAIKRAIRKRTKELGLPRGRVQVLNSGRIGDLAHYSSGMVVINSTSAFSALHHEVPVLVLGEAVFRHDGVVTLGDKDVDIAVFFRQRQVGQHHKIHAFMTDLKARSLLPGDFYIASGRRAAVTAIIGKIDQMQATAFQPGGAGL